MKVLFDHPQPFFLAHGGFQTQIEQTKRALEGLGVEVEWVRWWDDEQRGDLIHFFGRPPYAYVEFAQAKGLKVIVAELLTGLGSRGARARFVQTALIRLLSKSYFFDRMGWRSYQKVDAAVALTSWEANLMTEVFGAPRERVHVIPNGVELEFLEVEPAPARNQWLVCTATITPRKRVLELATAAVKAQTPLWVLGEPYSPDDPYAVEFCRLAAEHPELIRYEGAVRDRRKLARIYAEARGFVLLSSMESLSLSALEAAACGCPLLLSHLPWATTTFGQSALYCGIGERAYTDVVLRVFYDSAPDLPRPSRPESWKDIASKLDALYRRLLSTSS